MSRPETAYDQLFTAIQNGELSPGSRLLETELASRFGVSRTPIREAIRRLEEQGLVQHLPRVGAVVRSFGQQEIVQLYEMRIVLEQTAAEMAAKHATDAEISTLSALNHEMTNCENPRRIAQNNRQFHMCIVDAARNQFLRHSYMGLSHALILLGKTTLESSERLSLVTRQHEDIIRAIQNADAQAAKVAMRAHMAASLGHRLKGLHVTE